MRDRLSLVLLAMLVLACAGLADPAAWPPAAGEDEEGLPPIARLLLADGRAPAGALGSFAYRESYSDTPWFSAAGLEQHSVPAGAQPTVALRPGHRFVSWSAAYAAAGDPAAELVIPLAAGDGEPREREQLPALPSGDWVLRVHLTFADLEGDAAYYWSVSVP